MTEKEKLEQSRPQCQHDQPCSCDKDVEKYESMHGTNDYITSWDAMFAEPSDVYANGVDMDIFSSGAFDTGEEYPRGV